MEDVTKLMQELAAASANQDLAEVIRLGNILRKQKSEVEKAEAAKLQKEAEELAGAREALGVNIHKAIAKAMPEMLREVAQVKAQGFTYKLDGVDAQGGKVTYKSVALLVPQAKAKKASASSGVRVSTEEETGLKLGDLIDQYATQDEKAEIETAVAEVEDAKKGSRKWQAQMKVKSRILKDNPTLIKR